MTVTFRATVKAENVSKRLHARALRQANRNAMIRHVRVTLGDHYKQNDKTAPGGAYGYVARSAKYLRRKKIQKGHQDPLVLSGRTKRHIRNNAVITATQNKSTFRASNYFPMKTQMRAELEAVTRDEERDIGVFIDTEYSYLTKKPETTITRV